MKKEIKRIAMGSKQYAAQSLAQDEKITITSEWESTWANDQEAMSDLLNGNLIIYSDGEPIFKPAQAIQFLLNMIPARVKQTLADEEISLRPRGFNFTATKETMSPHTFVFDEVLKLRGGSLFSPNAKMGDWVCIKVLDASDNEIDTYVPKMMVFPNMVTKIEDVDTSQPMQAGWKLKVEYTSVSGATVDPEVAVNLTSYEIA